MAASIAISIAMVVAFDERAGWPPLGTTLSAVLAALLATGAEAFSILHGSRFSNPNLRRLGALQTVFFRRSGVITEGRPEITTVTPLKANATAEDVLHIASVAEYPVAHPIREAVLRRGMTQQRTVAPVRDARLVPGRGIIASLAGKEILFGNLRLLQDSGIQPGRLAEVSAAMRERKEQGESVLYACLGGEVVGAVSFLDRPRPDAGDALRAVAAAGFATGILSGDAPETVAAQTQALGAPGIEADLSAAERLAVLERSRQEGKGTALVSAEAASPTGEAAGFQLEVRDPGGPVGSGVRHGPPPLSVRCANLREVAQVLVACKSWRREARRQFLFLGLYQALLVPLLSGAFESWTGVPPSPALAAWLGAVLPYALLLL
jgi:high-affinity K+ transport system ATPase subunit B